MLFTRKQKFIEKSSLVHENKYDYSKVEYVDAHTHVEIICMEHGSFWQSPCHHSRGKQCPQCSNDSRVISTDIIIQRCIDTHGDKYDYSKSNPRGAHSKMEIICPIHGSFWQISKNHYNGQGCPACGEENRPFRKLIATDEFIQRCRSVHGDKYDYSKTNYVGAEHKIEIICPIHGSFWQKASNHYNNQQGCPDCANGQNISRLSTEWLESLSKNLIYEYRLPEKRNKPVDAYDPSTNTIYQFHGDYWHGNPDRFNSEQMNKTRGMTFGELYQRTLHSDQEIRDYGYNLVTMWEHDWNLIRSTFADNQYDQ